MFTIAIAFTFFMILANIYCLSQKKYLFLYIVCMLFLPDYYGISINQSIPVISFYRIMFIVFLIYAVVNRRCSFKEATIFTLKKANLFCAFVFFRIAANLYYVSFYNQAIETILGLIIEQVLSIVALSLLKPNESEVIEIIKGIVIVASFFFLFGILESFIGYRFFDLLYTVNRDMLNEYHYRMGVLKATTSFGLPGFYGDMCVVVLPLIFYCYRLTKKKVYLFFVGLDAMAVIHSGSRASIIFFMAICLLYIVIRIISSKSEWLELLRNAGCIMLFLFAVLVIIGSFSPKFNYFYVGTAKSILNVFGGDYDLDEDATEESGGYGENVDGKYSRMVQFTGIKYAYSINPVFGLGSGAQMRGDIKYFKHGKWRNSNTYDVGYVEIFMDEGILGTIGYLCLGGFAFCGLWSIYRNDKEQAMILFLCTIAYFMCLLATANAKKLLILIYGLIFICRISFIEKTSEDKLYS